MGALIENKAYIYLYNTEKLAKLYQNIYDGWDIKCIIYADLINNLLCVSFVCGAVKTCAKIGVLWLTAVYTARSKQIIFWEIYLTRARIYRCVMSITKLNTKQMYINTKIATKVLRWWTWKNHISAKIFNLINMIILIFRRRD